jgi:hypothetical protein
MQPVHGPTSGMARTIAKWSSEAYSLRSQYQHFPLLLIFLLFSFFFLIVEVSQTSLLFFFSFFFVEYDRLKV